MMFVLILVVAFSAFVLGYAIGGADRDDNDEDTARTLDELRRIHDRPPRLDGCTCEPVAGSHRPGCPWAMR